MRGDGGPACVGKPGGSALTKSPRPPLVAGWAFWPTRVRLRHKYKTGVTSPWSINQPKPKPKPKPVSFRPKQPFLIAYSTVRTYCTRSFSRSKSFAQHAHTQKRKGKGTLLAMLFISYMDDLYKEHILYITERSLCRASHGSPSGAICCTRSQ